MIDSPWFWIVLIPLLMWAPGLGWARYLARDKPLNRVHLSVHAAWLSMGACWFAVAFVRELGATSDTARGFIGGIMLAIGVIGALLTRGLPKPPPTSKRERLGVLAVVIAVIGVGVWKHGDIERHLHDHWYTEGADQLADPPLLLVPGDGWADAGRHWPESGARQLKPSGGRGTLIAPKSAAGPVVVALQGPVGAWIEVPGQPKKRIAKSMTEKTDEGPVRRYQDRGVAAVLIDLKLAAGEALTVQTGGGPDVRVTVFPSTLAVWELHGEGVLRFTHYYQMLNQVENLDWADEVLTTRRFTINQPPGWSPILATAGLFLGNDLVTGNRLFLFVILLVGVTAVRLASTLAPTAPTLAWLVPGGMVASHGLLMLEPASTNFPDSLFAAAVLAVALSLSAGRSSWLIAMSIAAGLLRWPGVVLSSLFILSWHTSQRTPSWAPLKRLWSVVGVGVVLAAVGVFTGDLPDLLFVLYFETFPEHWHGNYALPALLARVPDFFGLWTTYTGGGLLLAALFCFAPKTQARSGLRFLMGAIGVYSLFLCTIDHHPTHYFLPLIGITGVGVVLASDSVQNRALRIAFPTACLLGLWIFLRTGQV